VFGLFRRREPEPEPEIVEAAAEKEPEPEYCGPVIVKIYRVSIKPNDEKRCDAKFKKEITSKFQVSRPESLTEKAALPTTR